MQRLQQREADLCGQRERLAAEVREQNDSCAAAVAARHAAEMELRKLEGQCDRQRQEKETIVGQLQAVMEDLAVAQQELLELTSVPALRQGRE
jgi:chromosome segregation ATPase